MTEVIAPDAVKLTYLSLAEARSRPGLRLILGARSIPGPWREACKAMFQIKRIPYLPVASRGPDGSDRELREWTAQASAPVAIWNDERPRSGWIEQLNLAERLNPDPPLIPEAIEDRVLMFGYANELCGENGFGWSKRLTMIHAMRDNPAVDAGTRAFWTQFGDKYGYDPRAAAAAPGRMAAILRLLGQRLEQQQAAGRRFFIADRLSALDIYWATFAALIEPLPPEQCPMATAFRDFYTEKNQMVRAACNPKLLQHRDFIYREYLDLPVVF